MFVVAQASPQINQFIHQLQAFSGSALYPRFAELNRRFPAYGLLGLAGVSALLLWNWLLVLSVGIGLAVTVWVYLIHQGWWTLPKLSAVQKLWHRSNRSLTLGVSSGVIVACGSYGAIAIWRESQHSWLATGIILEGLMILAVLGVLIGQTLHRSLEPLIEKRVPADLPGLADLTDADPLKRLLAIRQLSQQTLNGCSGSALTSAHLTDCFRLMLNRETEPIVCRALLEELHSLKSLNKSLVNESIAPTQAIL